MVSMLAFYSDYMSSNLAKVGIIVFEKNEKTKRGRGWPNKKRFCSVWSPECNSNSTLQLDARPGRGLERGRGNRRQLGVALSTD